MAEADPYPLYTKFVAADGRTLKAFEELDLVEAYSYEKKKILNKLQEITKNENNKYGLRLPENQRDIKLLNDLIRHLTCNHSHDPSNDNPITDEDVATFFKIPVPSQHVHRKKDASDRLDVIRDPFTIGSRPMDYVALADYLGLFLSLLGSPPDAATRENYCFPLLCVYARWTLKLFCSDKTSKVNRLRAPSMVQITWLDQDTKLSNVYLGCSIAGTCSHPPSGMTSLMKDIRFDIVKHPQMDKDLRGFGACAETYPFACTLRGAETLEAQKYRGLALRPKAVQGVNTYLARDIALKDYIANPCENCAYLINIWNARLENFEYHPREGTSKNFPEDPLT